MNKLIKIVIICISIFLLSGCAKEAEYKKGNYEIGLKQVEENKYSEGLVSFKKSINENPKLTDSYIQAAKILEKKGQLDEAINILTNGIGFSDNDEIIFSELGEIYFLKSDFNKSLENYNKALNKNSEYVPGIIGKIESLVRIGNFAEAKEYAKSRDTKSDGFEAQVIKSFLFFDELDRAESFLSNIQSTNADENVFIDEYTKLISEVRNSPDKTINNNMSQARIMINFGKPSFATPLINNVIEENEFYEGGYLYRGIIQYLLSDYTNAEKSLLQSLSYNSDISETYRYLSLSQSQLGKNDESISNFNIALSNAISLDEGIYKDGIFIFKKANQNVKVFEMYSKLIALNTQNKNIYALELATLHCINEGSVSELQTTLSSITEDNFSDKKDKSVFFALQACSEWKNSNINEAKSLLTTSENLFTGNAITYYVGYVIFESEDNVKSENYKERLIDVDFDGTITLKVINNEL